MKITKCPNCASPVLNIDIYDDMRLYTYKCMSYEYFDENNEIIDTSKSWPCGEIERLKQELFHAEANYWDDRPRFFRD